MNVSLDQAIEIYARALKAWRSDRAPHKAREYASESEQAGDHHGCEVWLRVADAAEALLVEDR